MSIFNISEFTNNTYDIQPTHYLMTGGKLYVPDNKLNEFTNFILNNETPQSPLVERTNKNFKYYLDIDTENSDIKEIIKSAKDSINDFLGVEDVKHCTYKNNSFDKYHIIFDVKVNKEIAIQISSLVNDRAGNEILDMSAYNTGLRMPNCEKGQNNKTYYIHLDGDISPSILDISHLPDFKLTQEASKWLKYMKKTTSKNEMISLTTPAENTILNNILNEMFKISNHTWKIEKFETFTQCTPMSLRPCLIDNEHTHGTFQHSCLVVSKRQCTLQCFSHGKKKLLINEYPGISDLRISLGYKINKNKDIDLIGDIVDLTDEDRDIILSFYSGCNDDIAKVFHYFYKNEFICASESPNMVWFKFKDGLWTELNGTSELVKHFSNRIKSIYRTVIFEQRELIKSITDEKEKLNVQCRLDGLVLTYHTHLGKNQSIQQIIKQMVYLFKIDKFIERLDENRHLLCFGVDVFDLKINEWRKTEPEDLCSRRCGVDKEDINNKYCNELSDVLNDIFQVQDRREYMLSTLSDFLFGNNTKEKFHIWMGAGRNGKGVLANILKVAFGDYYAEVRVSLLTQKNDNANNANPELAKLRGVRIAMFSEPEEGAKLNNSTIKLYTGGDDLSTRMLYGAPFSFRPQFHPIIQTNVSFNLQDIKDDSIPLRLNFQKFNTSFIDKKDIKFNHQKEKNNNIKNPDNILKLAKALMYVLIYQWGQLSPSHVFNTPQSITEDKNEFLDENNYAKMFINENIEHTDDDTDILKAKDLMTKYKEWFDVRGERMPKTTLKTFIRSISKYMPIFKQRHQPSTDGGQVCYRQCFLKCKLIEE